MGVMDVIRSRRSIRKWKDDPVSKAQIESLMEAAQKAPSAVDRQPYRFVLVDDVEKRKLVSKAAGQRFVARAPLLVVGVGEPERSPTWYLIDTVIALTQMYLVAYEVGLAGVWIGAFDEDRVKSALEIPRELVVAGILALGVPNQQPRPISRKSIEELFSRNNYIQSVK